jgi:hypothetical protein
MKKKLLIMVLIMLSVGLRLNDGGRKNKILKTEYGEKDF